MKPNYANPDAVVEPKRLEAGMRSAAEYDTHALQGEGRIVGWLTL
jgi:hypothetical protein